MTIEERLKSMLGEAQFGLAVMSVQLEEAQKALAEAQKKIAELEKNKGKETP